MKSKDLCTGLIGDQFETMGIGSRGRGVVAPPGFSNMVQIK